MQRRGLDNEKSVMMMKMSPTRRRRTWYGLMAQVTLGPGFLHRVGFGRVILPHPPLANWLLRSGLSDETHRCLSFAHEFAHFQTAPVALLHLVVLFTAVYFKGRIGISSILIILISTHSAWEMLSEGLVAIAAPTDYNHAYEGVSRLPRILFWWVGVALTVAGWVMALQSFS